MGCLTLVPHIYSRNWIPHIGVSRMGPGARSQVKVLPMGPESQVKVTGPRSCLWVSPRGPGSCLWVSDPKSQVKGSGSWIQHMGHGFRFPDPTCPVCCFITLLCFNKKNPKAAVCRCCTK